MIEGLVRPRKREKESVNALLFFSRKPDQNQPGAPAVGCLPYFPVPPTTLVYRLVMATSIKRKGLFSLVTTSGPW